ncbi:MAG TPA: nitroreductase/quinone reductase family protein [Solirubrobacteraceae bacterium]|jgi:deazaflavin-dependent oxidoreductase (nitroreductase family)|nr:nitroreductase/quinone reductase family protein [Solirubrobacteraceae bacterium]
MPSLADVYAKISPYLAEKPGAAAATRLHARILRATGGRISGRVLGVQTDVLVLRTIGRRSGKPRDAPMFSLKHGDGYAVVASNGAAKHTPAWWHNLQAQPDAEAFVAGKSYPVRARAASAQEVNELWPRFVQIYSGYEYYKSIATRDLPVVILEPR